MGKFKVSLMLTLLIFVLAACGGTTETKETGEVEGAEAPKTVEITDAHGTIDVPVNPEKVVALDNRTFETLAAWDIELAAAPIGLLPAESPYAKDSDIADVGMHFEPNLEAIAGVDPDVVIVGQRFADYYEDIKKLVPNAAVIDLYIDIPEDTGTPGEILVKGLTDTTLTLGKIFDKNEEAAQLVADLDNSIDGVKSAYNGEDTIMSVIVSGDHQGDEVSVEAIAESNPDWLFVLDRDAPLAGAEGAVPAADVIDNAPALQKTTAVKEKNIVYAPNDTYLNESIQTYAEMFNDIAQALKK